MVKKSDDGREIMNIMRAKKRLFAWMSTRSDRFNYLLYGPYKKELFRNLEGLIVEIGPGSGGNLSYLPDGVEWYGIEPNEAFHKTLLTKAEEYGIKACLVTGDATHIPLADDTVDFILCTLVLCSVKNPSEAIHEMIRILKPNGKFIFIEHVAAPERTILRMAQEFLNPLNRFIADGCNCNRETWTPIQNAGFTHVELFHQNVTGAMKIHTPHIMGYAVK